MFWSAHHECTFFSQWMRPVFYCVDETKQAMYEDCCCHLHFTWFAFQHSANSPNHLFHIFLSRCLIPVHNNTCKKPVRYIEQASSWIFHTLKFFLSDITWRAIHAMPCGHPFRSMHRNIKRKIVVHLNMCQLGEAWMLSGDKCQVCAAWTRIS